MNPDAVPAPATNRYYETVLKTWEDNRLFSVLLELTYRCNLDCYFCYNDTGLRGQPLATGQYLSLLAELADLQVLHLVLSGGEPLAHPDFFVIGGRARELGFVVRMKTNGHALRGALARRVREEVDPYAVEISLHGATAATHDRQTRVPGSFDRLLPNLREALGLGLRVQLNSTMTAWNEHEIEAMYALANELGVPLRIDPEVSPRDDGDRSPLSIRPSREAIRRMFAIGQEASARALAAAGPAAPPALTIAREGDALPSGGARKHCGAGSSGLAIDPYGNVYPCVQWRRPVGNLHQSTVREIWGSSRALAEIRDLTAGIHDRMVAEGPGAALLNFCPGNAETATGDPGALYPAAVERRELLSEVMAAAPRRGLLPVLR